MKRLILFVSLIGLVMMFWLTLPNNKPVVVVCDVGQGDAILATYKNIQILFDVGPKNKKVLKCLENHLPFWDKTIEAVVLSHGDSDHTGGLTDLLKIYKVENFFSNGYLEGEIEQKIYSRKLSQNDVLSLGLFNFEVVWPPSTNSELQDGNENSVAGILRVKNKNWSMFLSGDMENEAEQKLVWRQILNEPVTFLKVSHHGSATATSQELLDVLKPKVAVISVGGNNRFGHPTKDVLDRLEKMAVEVKRTDLEGEVVF
ncbi:MAG: MBL fold metallo-hydrolase [Candidatus Shapirobacteria bacterium]|nr:MBL fold metallo-hydrolase [Candidatus Shapirobacteria bacterium]